MSEKNIYYTNSGKIPQILGLRTEIKKGTRKGNPYYYMVFLDEEGIKWRIQPKRNSFELKHRNSRGKGREHIQLGLGNIVQLRKIIEEHENYEKRKEMCLPIDFKQLSKRDKEKYILNMFEKEKLTRAEITKITELSRKRINGILILKEEKEE